MRARTRTGLGVLAAGVASVLLAGTASAAPAPGAPGVGDSYYPNAGNGGTDVLHYDIRLTYQPATDVLAGHDDAAAHRHAGPLAVRPGLRAEGVERAREQPPCAVREPDRQRRARRHPG